MRGPLLVELRARKGEYVEQKRFDLERVSRRVAELEKEYGVSFDPSSPAPSEDLAKPVFEAGFTLAVETGLYVVDESRVARFTEEEVREALRNAPRELRVGRGKDERVLRARGPGDRVFVFGGLAGTPVPLEFFEASAASYAAVPRVDALDHGSIQAVAGEAVRGYAPSEALAGIEEAEGVRRALRAVGRPGMHVLGAESSVSSVGSLSALSLGLLGEGDAQLLPVLNELKTDYGQLTKAYVGLARGLIGAALVDPVVGGYARGPAGSAIVSVAETLLALVAYEAGYFLVHPVHILRKATSTLECMWVESVVGLANRYMGLPVVADIWPANGGGTREYLYEAAANTFVAVASGLNVLGPVPANGTQPNGGGFESWFVASLADLVAEKKVSVGAAWSAALELYEKYADKLSSPNPGKPFWELYDLKSLKPSAEWEKTVWEVLREVAELA
ncbi:monomethylamine:corrinoid methyltransferase [Thermofilum pendens]|uniref:[methylamine--corrinoid protein] Co-methyltransferase n=1 Tax=Thermofilum pendens (strain DSM 2475 / Hrk 5) TaxID=368408 RepID=A1RZH9_THEPD|nr:monomethylamine:corrinoid methyltransferase [Thermofilum pendens]ABL78609.1 monomethylamine:corrinoid methyltransferase [Thermofilum pendens Hrk 5]